MAFDAFFTSGTGFGYEDINSSIYMHGIGGGTSLLVTTDRVATEDETYRIFPPVLP